MIIYTVIRHIDDKIIPLRNFVCPKEAEKWAELQMTYLDKDYSYSIALWNTIHAHVTPCVDRRLRLVK